MHRAITVERIPDEADPDDHGAGERARHPHDPRATVANHRERGPERFPRRRPGWTRPMVAELAGRSLAAVRKAERAGLLDMGDLASVMTWVARARGILLTFG